MKYYFEKNIIAYSYLFFAQVTAAAVNVYLEMIRKNPPFYIKFLPLGIVVGIGEIYVIFLPLFFVYAAYKSFNYDFLEKDSKIFLWGVNLILYGVVIASAFSLIKIK